MHDARRRHDLLPRLADEPPQPLDHWLQCGADFRIGEGESVDRDDQPARQRRRDRLVEHDTRRLGEGASVAREPPRGVGAGRLRHHTGDGKPAMRRPDSVEPAETRRHAHRAAGVGAEGGVANSGGNRGGRARGRAARHMARGARVCGRAVERVLAEDAERNFVGDGLADKGRAGVEQGLHRPGMPLRHLVGARPVGVAAAGRIPCDIEQILAGKGQTGELSARSPLDMYARTGHKSIDVVIWHVGPQSSHGIRTQYAMCTPRAHRSVGSAVRMTAASADELSRCSVCPSFSPAVCDRREIHHVNAVVRSSTAPLF